MNLTVARVPTEVWMFHVKRVLPKEWAHSVLRHLRNLPADANHYEEVKDLLLILMSTGAFHARRLANLPTLGNKRPSELMNHMLSLLPHLPQPSLVTCIFICS